MTHSFSQPNQSVLAGIECLQWLASSHHPISNIEMARRMNVDRNRANRLLKSLVMAGMAQQTPDRKFIVGNGFHALAAQSLRASGILGLSLPSLESLRRFEGIVALGVLWKREVAYLYHSNPMSTKHSPISSRESISATESSIGMMLLSRLPAATVDQLFKDGDTKPFRDIAELKAELLANRARGFSRIFTPHTDKPSSVSEAVTISQKGEYVAAIALSDVPERFPSEERVAALRSAAADIEAALKAQANAVR